MNDDVIDMLLNKGADIVRAIDISNLSANQTQGFSKAIVFCMALSKKFVIAKRNNEVIERDEFVDKERETDALADWLAEYLRQNGYPAYSQSEESHRQNGNYDEKTYSSRLPHKTIGHLAGIGYIGKNNLLINEKYGCAFSMCTVLTNAPITTEKYTLASSECGECSICEQVCSENAIIGCEWSEHTHRKDIIDVFKCTCALKCMVNCPRSLNYALQIGESVLV